MARRTLGLNMKLGVRVRKAGVDDAAQVAELVGELLNEIMNGVGVQVFHFDLGDSTKRLIDFLNAEKYFVFIACDVSEKPIGFIALSESYALYAEGGFGIIPEFYVRPEYRSKGVGLSLISQAKQFGASRGWRRLEVTTPPLPEFNKTLSFYEREGFSIAGGRKMKLTL